MKYLVLVLVLSLTSCGWDKCNLEKGHCESNIDNELKKKHGEQEAEIAELYSIINALTLAVNNTSNDVDSLQLTMNSLLVQVAEIETRTTVVELIDPCGDKPGKFDEILIRLSTGSLIAYFEDGGKRFLTELEPGAYRTTDAQACNFLVTHTGDILD